MPKIVPKSIQTCFRVIFLEKILCLVFHGGSSFRKFSKIFFFKIPKMPKIVPESIQTCFERVLGQIFRIIFLPSVPWRVEFSKIFKKNIFKIPKMPKSVLKSIQTCFEHVLGKNFRKKNCPVFHGRSSLRKFSKKIKKVSNFLKCPKLFPKVSKRVLG